MKIIITSITLLFSLFGFACDNCNVYQCISSNDYRNSISIFMRQRAMFGEYNSLGEMITTRHTGHGDDKAFWGKKVYETYQTYEIRGSFYFKEKWKTTVILPFEYNTQRIGTVKRFAVHGIGDPIILESYQVFNTKNDTSKSNFSHRLKIGGGLKFPIGKTNMEMENITPHLDLQPGTGSWDMLSFFTYAIKWKTVGLFVNSNLKINGKNKDDYRYGKVVNGTLNLFTDLTLKKFTCRLIGGVYAENASKDASYYGYYNVKFPHNDTGGNVWFANAGLQVFTKNFVLFGEYQQVFKSNLNGNTQLLTNNKFNVGITYKL